MSNPNPKPALGYSAIALHVLSIIAAIVAIGLPSWVIVAAEFDDDYSIMGGRFSSQSGLFQFCQVIFNNFDCRYYTGFECIGPPDFQRSCWNRRGAAGLMVAGLVLSIVGLFVYSFTSLKSANKAGAISSMVLTGLSVIFFIISMGLMVDVKRVVHWSSQFTFRPDWIDMLGVFYGPSFVLCIVAWVLALIATSLYALHSSSTRPANHNSSTTNNVKKVETTKETVYIH